MSLYSAQSHTFARTQLVYCLALTIQLILSVCAHPFSAAIFVSERIFAYLPSYSDIFLAGFRENGKLRPSDSH